MDFNKIMARAKAILFTPKTEWPLIAGEPATIKGLYTGYILILAAIPPIFAFIKHSLIGSSAFGMHVRTGIGAGIGGLIVTYVLSLVVIYVVALIINALAKTFGGEPNQVQALKAIAYAYTASWIAGIAIIIPWLGWLVMLLGGIYSIYLLYLGLPATMKCPPDKAAGYTAVTIIATVILMIVVGAIVGGITGVSMMGHSVAQSSSSSSSVTFDKDSTLGKLNAMSQRMDAASKKLEAAQKSGDGKSAGAALGAMMGAMAGSDKAVQALGPDQLKPFAPASLGGMQRSSISASRNTALGMQVSEVKATYKGANGQQLTLSINDMGGAKGLMSLAGLAGESESQSDHGYEKTYKQDGRIVHEKWDNRSQRGEFSTVIGDRFSVEVKGHADSMDDLKHAVASVDLSGLAALKNHGVSND